MEHNQQVSVPDVVRQFVYYFYQHIRCGSNSSIVKRG